MATNPQDREDLLGEATGLPVRGQFVIGGREIVVGFRDDGAASWYFDQDPVFQFDAKQLLRRVFLKGEKYAVAGGRIVRLARHSSSPRMSFSREPLSESATGDLLELWTCSITPVRGAFQGGSLQWNGSTVDESQLGSRIAVWLETLPEPIELATNT